MSVSRRRFLSGSCAVAMLPFLGNPAVRASQTSELSFLVVGDWGKPDLSADARAVAAQMAKEAEARDASFVISAGDNFYGEGVDSVNDPLWKTVFEDVYSAPSLQVPWYVVLGNHDYEARPDVQLAYALTSSRWIIESRYYVIQKSVSDDVTADFFFLDTTMLGHGRFSGKRFKPEDDAEAQLDWLDAMLAASPANWKIVVGHHPIYSGGRHGNTRALVDALLPILKRHDVQVYINGHNHNLEHVERGGIHFLTSGAGAEPQPAKEVKGTRFVAETLGFLSATLTADELRIAFVDDTGAVLHGSSVRLSRPGGQVD